MILLPEMIGLRKTKEMLFTGKIYTAQEAKELGLVNKVVPTEGLRQTAENLAKTIMQAAPSSVKAIKKLLYLRFKREELEKSVEELIKIVQSAEGKEGHKAFVEKRQPKWAES